jgi:hypothetical protein
MRAQPFARISSLIAICGAVATIASACGSSDESLFNDGNADAGDGGNAQDGDPTFGNPIDSGGETNLNACATETQEAKQLPLDMLIMLDTSGSLYARTKSGSPKYVDIRTALTSFFNDPATTGTSVGLQIFPKFTNAPNACTSNAQCGTAGPCILKACKLANPNGSARACGDDTDCPGGGNDCSVALGQCHERGEYKCRTAADCKETIDTVPYDYGTCDMPMVATRCGNEITDCSKEAYSKDLVAPIALLPAASPALVTALNGVYPNGGTPTRPALEGAVDVAVTHAAATPGHRTIVVLATDGFPFGCTNNAVADSAKAADDGLKRGIKTFVVGIFSAADQAESKKSFDQISSAGGAGAAFIINTDENVAQALKKAFDDIRREALTCEFPLPKPEAGTPDYGKVNVRYTPGTGAAEVFPNAPDAAGCSADKGGWYYDVNPATGTPTKVTLCPSACTRVKADPAAKIDVVQGCKTIVLVK